jgi:hypothetical protein
MGLQKGSNTKIPKKAFLSLADFFFKKVQNQSKNSILNLFWHNTIPLTKFELMRKLRFQLR